MNIKHPFIRKIWKKAIWYTVLWNMDMHLPFCGFDVEGIDKLWFMSVFVYQRHPNILNMTLDFEFINVGRHG